MLADRAIYDGRIADVCWRDDERVVIRDVLGDSVYECLRDPVPLRTRRRRTEAMIHEEKRTHAAASKAIGLATGASENTRAVTECFVHLALAKMYFATRDHGSNEGDVGDADGVIYADPEVECREHLWVAMTRAKEIKHYSCEAACWKLWARHYARGSQLEIAVHLMARAIIYSGNSIMCRGDGEDYRQLDYVAYARDNYDVAMMIRGFFFTKAMYAEEHHVDRPHSCEKFPHHEAAPYLKEAKEMLDTILYPSEGTYVEFSEHETSELYCDICLHLADVMQNHKKSPEEWGEGEAKAKIQKACSVIANGYRILAHERTAKENKPSIFDAECPLCAERVGGLSVDEEPVTFCWPQCPRRHHMHVACYNSLGNTIASCFATRQKTRDTEDEFAYEHDPHVYGDYSFDREMYFDPYKCCLACCLEDDAYADQFAERHEHKFKVLRAVANRVLRDARIKVQARAYAALESNKDFLARAR